MKLLAIGLVVFAPYLAMAEDGRPSGYYGQLGIGGTNATISNEGLRSNYRGWGYDLEGGMDLASNPAFGLNVAGLMQFSDVYNKSSGSTFAETGEFKGVGAKAGLYFGPMTFGAGLKKTTLNTQELSSASGFVKTELQGEEKFVFVNLTFNINKKYRSTAELNYSTGTLGTLKSTQMNLFLRVGIIDFFGR